MHLNGKQTLAYVRKRKGVAGGDFARNERQQEVVGLLLNKMVRFDNIGKFSEITETLGKNLQHGFQVDEIPALVKVYQDIPKENVQSIQVKVVDIKVGKADMLQIPQAEKDRIRKILQQQLEYTPNENLIDKTDDVPQSNATN
jgi:polyisoprenyl-teichoic acid--peptidoglycan teichoic acid transferase